jgi:hypothetical protein
VIKNRNIRYLFLLAICFTLVVILLNACSGNPPAKKRIFEGYGLWMDTVLKSSDKTVRGIEIGTAVSELKKLEIISPTEEDTSQVYYEIKADSVTNASVTYSISQNKIDEIEIIVNCKSPNEGANMFSDLKRYLESKYPTPVEEKGVFVFSGKTSGGETFKISLEDESGLDNAQINLLVYREK